MSALKIYVTVLYSLLLAWFAFWNGIEFCNYKWIYSPDNTVKAGQYLLQTLWGLFFLTSPIWWAASTFLIAKELLFKPKPKT